MLVVSLCFFILPLCLDGAVISPTPKFMYDVPLSFNPSFCSILEDKEASANAGYPVNDVGVSSFTGDVDAKDGAYSLNAVNNYLQESSFTTNLLTDELRWPNEVNQVPDGVFGMRVWTVASGFFLPGKDNGSIALIDVTDKSNTVPVLITPTSGSKIWFYHRVLWKDMNNDGHVDAVTARAYGSGAAATESQLIWLENPGLKYITPSWKLHVIHEGTEDIAFRIHDMPLQEGTTTTVIISTGFWSNELGLTWSSTSNWLDSSSIQHLSVDKFGWYFDLQIVDVNADGRMDVLCTTWSQLGSPGALLAYEIPDDWQTEPWTRHVLQDGYTAFRLPGSGSPGSAVAFWPVLEMKNDGYKPYVIVSGDDNGEAYVVTADSEASNDWSYTSTTIYTQQKGTVGAIAVGDVDNDGFAEVFLPSYEEKFIRVMTYLQ